MKALSLRQPWAELILQGRKTIETRTWNTQFRGRFYIHAAKSVNKLWCELFGIQNSVTGMLVGSAELVEVKEYNSLAQWAADNEKHCCHLDIWTKKRYGFVLKKVQRIKSVPCKGKLNFFEVDTGAKLKDAHSDLWV